MSTARPPAPTNAGNTSATYTAAAPRSHPKQAMATVDAGREGLLATQSIICSPVPGDHDITVRTDQARPLAGAARIPESWRAQRTIVIEAVDVNV